MAQYIQKDIPPREESSGIGRLASRVLGTAATGAAIYFGGRATRVLAGRPLAELMARTVRTLEPRIARLTTLTNTLGQFMETRPGIVSSLFKRSATGPGRNTIDDIISGQRSAWLNAKTYARERAMPTLTEVESSFFYHGQQIAQLDSALARGSQNAVDRARILELRTDTMRRMQATIRGMAEVHQKTMATSDLVTAMRHEGYGIATLSDSVRELAIRKVGSREGATALQGILEESGLGTTLSGIGAWVRPNVQGTKRLFTPTHYLKQFHEGVIQKFRLFAFGERLMPGHFGGGITGPTSADSAFAIAKHDLGRFGISPELAPFGARWTRTGIGTGDIRAITETGHVSEKVLASNIVPGRARDVVAQAAYERTGQQWARWQPMRGVSPDVARTLGFEHSAEVPTIWRYANEYLTGQPALVTKQSNMTGYQAGRAFGGEQFLRDIETFKMAGLTGSDYEIGARIAPKWVPIAKGPGGFLKSLFQGYATGPSNIYSFMGLGHTRSSTFPGAIGKFMLRGGIIGSGYLAYKYADYKVRSNKLLDYTPFSEGITQAPLDAWAGANVAAATLQEYTLIRPIAREMETWLPGSVESPLAAGIRGFGPGVALGMWMGRAAGSTRMGLAGLGIGLLGSFTLLGGAGSLKPTPSELSDIYSGKQLVPIKKGRWFPFSSDSWSGSETKYYRPHYIALNRANAVAEGSYGNEAEYWKHMPVFSILEGSPFAPITDPYWWENQNQGNRPYNVSGSLWNMSDIPLLGLAAWPLEMAIKPPVRYDQGNVDLPSQANLMYRGSMALAQMQDIMGLAGFGMGSIIESVTGLRDYMTNQEVLASPTMATGPSARYYEANLNDIGFPLPVNELLRRYIAKPRGSVLYMNTLANNTPCLHPNTEVLLSNNTTCKASDLEIGMKIISKEGDEATILNKALFQCDTFYKITLYGDNVSYTSYSHDHPIYTSNYQFVNAIDLRINDYIAFPRRLYHGTEVETIDLAQYVTTDTISDEWIYYGINSNNWESHEIANQFGYNWDNMPQDIRNKVRRVMQYYPKSKHKIKRFKRFWKKSDFYFLLGVFTGEGSWGQKDKSIKLSGHANDKWELELIRILNLYHVSYNYNDKNHNRNYIIPIPLFAKMIYQVAGGHAHEKKVPGMILDRENNENDVKQYLKALIDADGYYIRTADNRIKLGLHTISKVLAYQFRNMIIDLYGLVPALTQGKCNNHLAYHITLSGLQANYVAVDLGYTIHSYTPKQDNNKTYTDGKYVFIKIKNIEVHHDADHVVGIYVSGNNTFCTANMATHNTWLPGHRSVFGEDIGYYIDFHLGDPTGQIEMGNVRLPGPGFEALHPELKGLDPEQYPDQYKLQILGDVAPYSSAYKFFKRKLQSGGKNESTPYKADDIQKIINYRDRVVAGREFNYEYKTDEEWAQYPLPLRIIGKLWESGTHLAANTPIPSYSLFMRKLLPAASAAEEYMWSEAYGSPTSNWGHPVRDFVDPYFGRLAMPSTSMLKYPLVFLGGPLSFGSNLTGLAAGTLFTGYSVLGSKDISERANERYAIDEYMDRLTYVRNNMLANKAEDLGLADQALMYRERAGGKFSESYTGMSLQRDPADYMRAIPKRERAYFTQFLNAPSDEREQILNMVNPQMGKVLRGQWNAQRGVVDIGEPVEDDLGAFLTTHNLPSTSWSGWHPQAQMEHTKYKIVQALGRDTTEHNLWLTDYYQMQRAKVVGGLPGSIVQTGSSTESQINQAIDGTYGQDGIIQYLSVGDFGYNTIDADYQIDHTKAMIEYRRRKRSAPQYGAY